MKTRACTPALLALALALAAHAPERGVGQTRPEPGALVPTVMHGAFLRTSFRGVNETDAKAAFKVFATRMGELRGYAVTQHVHVFDNVETLAAGLKEIPLDLLVIDTWEYLSLAPIANLPATFSAIENGQVEEDFMVLVREDSDITSLGDLAGRHVLVLQSSNASAVRHWFEVEVLSLGQGGPEEYLGRFEGKERASQVVLPVFFGQADACVIDRGSIDLLVEMNPQIGKALRAVVTSEPFVDTILAVRLEGWDAPHMRGDFISAVQDLPNDAAGRQIMTLFRFDGVVPFQPAHLDAMRRLRERYDRLIAARGGDFPPSGEVP